uniref:Acyl-CoA thioester hydrolase n=1 Tax=Candidatus Kentrum sp. DK TaxID=2126562 RepID=A0A450SF54_9GAMM|nr:MAG: acyl-CoA thioester hydrolase [Candidatus Kentron sp. DK]VFJ61798.1 MAG: acyl-CoA thioester hydrolase [Candidatus Kentron sp. DK]
MTDNIIKNARPARRSRAISHREIIRTYHEDMDDLGVVYYANYLKFMSRARGEWLRAIGFDQAAFLRDRRLVFAVTRVEVDFLRPARLDDQLAVSATLQGVGAASLDFQQEVKLVSGGLLCRGYVKLACVHADTLRPRRIPPELLEKLTWRQVEKPGCVS